ncbi:MAG: hypothetical protein QME52_11110 [Bacteroidota bacterium]|nr:hypothetical protein [Bacteroidota bacterium]
MRDYISHSPQALFSVILAITIAGLVCLAWSHRFIQDDAFISFRYAQNLAQGNGLVWNVGERIEGYTNFLWTLLISLGIYLGCEPIMLSYILGTLFFILSLFFTYKLSFLITNSHKIAHLTVILLGTNYTFFCFATGGLETQMQAALFVISSYICIQGLLLNQWSKNQLFLLSLLLTISILTRLDSVLMVGILASVTIYHTLKESFTFKHKLLKLFVFISPLIFVVGVWMLWKLSYYGDILPNTFYIKASAVTSPLNGLHYIYRFIFSYLLFPLFIVGVFAIRSFLKNHNSTMLILTAIILLWLLYVIKIGGDFMEFRFMVPILPLLFIFFSWVIFHFVNKTGYRMVLIGLIFIGSIHHVYTFTYKPSDRIEPIVELHGHIYADSQNWSGIGKALGHFFNDTPDVTIATTAAGAIPYYSGLRTIDMYGLNDAWIARSGFFIGSTPGHQRMSPFGYLRDQQVNLVLSHPGVMKLRDPVTHLPYLPMNPNDKLDTSRVIEIPLDANYKILTLYLTHHPKIDEIIENNRWKVHTFTVK